MILFPALIAAQTFIKEWQNVKAPPASELKSAAIDPRSTALLLFDFNKQSCNAAQRPGCIASIPKVAKLLSAARTSGTFVVYSLSAAASPADIAAELVPKPSDPVVTSHVDKFLGTELEKILKEKDIKTVIVTGTVAHGAVLYTASEAALRGMKVVVPVDGPSADSLYPEQYVV
jgi:nicotinamidase-related amidase